MERNWFTRRMNNMVAGDWPGSLIPVSVVAGSFLVFLLIVFLGGL